MIALKSPVDLNGIRVAGQVVARVLDAMADRICPGMRTQELDEWAAREILQCGGRSAFKGYLGYPSHICVSINQEVVHGIPGPRQLQEGDLVSVDVGVQCGRYVADAARSFALPPASEITLSLIEAAEESFLAGICQMRVGNHLSDISHAVEEAVRRRPLEVVREFVGHGVGFALHEEPQVPNFGPAGRGPLLKPGWVLAIEPMVCEGTEKVRILADGWTVVTQDGKRASHYEETVGLSDSGVEILTFGRTSCALEPQWALNGFPTSKRASVRRAESA